jgi:hypothetical protein
MRYLAKSFILSTVIVMLTISCKEDGDQLTNAKPIRLTTKVVEGITASSALSGGNISNDGGTVILERGVVWSTSRNPGVSLASKTSDGFGAGEFTSMLTGLLPSTTYFVRSYATNRDGTEYGNEVSFVTETNLPTLTTSRVSEITASTVLSGGTIIKDGGLPILERGVVWSTATNPTISLPTKTSEGTGSGNYISKITGLTYGVKYYLRAYATNSAGTSYGNEITFESESPWNELEDALTQKMAQYDIPGLSIAIIRNEKLVYIKSFGYSEKEANKIATNEDLYRIADASKILTWIATLRLVDDWGSPLDDIVFGSNSILGKDYPAPPIGSGKESLTVANFLEHKSGWVNSPYDPMMADNALTQQQIIRDILLNRPLTYAPGTTYHDLNFGYCVLGRVIEKITNIPYENYVKSIMNEYGVVDIKIGGNTLRERLPKEVKYYQAEHDPYSLNIKRMDAHGGWVASAKDLAKIMVRIDGNLNVPDIFITAPYNQVYIASQWVQYGSLPGSSSILHRLDNNYSFVLLTNTRSENDPSKLMTDLDNTVINQIKARPSWPSYDLFY